MTVDLSNPDPARLLSEVTALAARTPPGPHPVVFIGSSTFTMWSTLDADLGGIGAVNHGFGGSQLSDCIHYLDRLVLPFRPRLAVLYGGDNDLANGKSIERVLADFAEFQKRIFTALPATRIAWVSIKTSIARRDQLPAQTTVNDTVEAASRVDRRLSFLDIRPAMLDPDGAPWPHHFLSDGLHLSPAGYAAWADILRPRFASDPLLAAPSAPPAA